MPTTQILSQSLVAAIESTPVPRRPQALHGVRRLRRTLLLLAVVGLNSSVAANGLPASSNYLGEIRRDASGKLVAVPAPPADTASGVASPTDATTRIIRVGPGQSARTIAAAAALAQDGDTIEIEAGDYRGDVAVWKQNNLIIRGVGGRVRLLASGASAEKKAIWVVRGGAITVENIEFTGARVPDRNGAGIRFEKGHLVIRNCRFIDNENGIIGGGPDAELDIENSEFGHNGAGDGYSHNLYAGALRRLRVTGSYFHHARAGHLLKSRALENHILYNRLTDEAGGHASYELEFPNGGIAYVIGNIIEQSATTENGTIVSFGAEGYKRPTNELYLVNNTIADDRPAGGRFLAVKPGAGVIKAYNNLLFGKGPLHTGVIGIFANNPNVEADAFAATSRHDYRIKSDSPLQRTYLAPGEANGIELAPTHEYVHPAATRLLTGSPTLPGARQTMQPDSTGQ